MSIYTADLNDPFVVSIQKFIKEDDYTIPEDAVLSMSGELNPFYGMTHTDEAKAKISIAALNRVYSEEYKQRMSETLKKRNAENPRSQEWCDNLSNALKGKKKTEEHRNNLSKTLSDGRMAGENNPRYGAVVTEETRQKMSESLKGKLAGDKNPMYGKSATKGKKWYNNGKSSGRFIEGDQPEGYVKGRLRKQG